MQHSTLFSCTMGLPAIAVVAALTFMIAVSRPTDAIELSSIQIRQTDFYGNNAPVLVNSAWGDIQLTLHPDADTTTYYFNLLIRHDSVSPAYWVIRNMLLPSSLDITNALVVSRFFSLADLRDVDTVVTSLQYQITLSPGPIQSAPAPGVFVPHAVLDGLYDAEGCRKQLGEASPANPGAPPAQQAQPAPAPPAKQKKLREDVPHLEERKMECFPASVTRSLRWLHNNGKIDLGPTTDAQLLQSIETAAGWTAEKGIVGIAKHLDGKLAVTKNLRVVNKFMEGNGPELPAKNYTNTDGTVLYRGADPTFAFIRDEIEAGEDVEIVVGWLNNTGVRTAGHALTVVGYVEDAANGKKEIYVQDDPAQDHAGDEKQVRNTRYTDPAGGSPASCPDLPKNAVDMVVSESPNTKTTLGPDGSVQWGDGSDQRPIRDVVPANGGKLSFYWTLGEYVAGKPPVPHPQYDKYEETNNTATAKARKFYRPNDNSITDWTQTVTGSDGKSVVYGGNIKQGSPWAFYPLATLPLTSWRIPDLAPIAGTPDSAIYTAINLDLYFQSNPVGFLNGNWAPGQTLSSLGLSIVNGQASGVQGIYWATREFTFDPNSATGWIPADGLSWLNSTQYPFPIEILAEHWSAPGAATGVRSPSGNASGLILEAGPNPFRTNMTIHYILPERARVRIGVYDAAGRRVRLLTTTTQDAGEYRCDWDGSSDKGVPVAAALYFVRLEAGSETRVRRVVLVRE